MERILIKNTIQYRGGRVSVRGWVDSRRDHGKIVFIDLRDRSGVLQVVCNPDLVKDVREEWAIEVEGRVKERPVKMVNPELETGKIELEAESVKVLAKAEVLPFDLRELKLTLPTLLDYRPLTLRNRRIKAIFKIQEEIINGFKETLKNLGFNEFQAPVIVPSNAEGGAAVFHVDYYDYDAYLAQSPQLYKQIMLSCFERVFTVNHVFRAEPSVTTRHLIDSWTDLMDVCEKIFRNIFSKLETNCQAELKAHSAALPQIGQKIPRLKMREAQEIIFQRTKRDNREASDLEPEDEKEICEWAKEKYGSELIFITHYPTKKRPFYTYADPEDLDYTLSFDLLFRGLEAVTGGQRINQYDKLVENIKKWGNRPEDFSYYLQAFRYGMPPEGGFALGSERITKQILGLENVREACLFPRDMERIDERLSRFEVRKPAKRKSAKPKKRKRAKK